MAPLSPPMFANIFRSWCHHKAQTISTLHSMLPTTDDIAPRTTRRPRPTLPITRSHPDVCLDGVVAALTDLGMNWRRTVTPATADWRGSQFVEQRRRGGRSVVCRCALFHSKNFHFSFFQFFSFSPPLPPSPSPPSPLP